MTQKWLTDELTAAGMAGVVPSHGDVLACLFRNGPTAMHDLAAFSHRTRPTTTVLVDKLEQMGLVRRERSDDDARSTVVALTDAGEALRGKSSPFRGGSSDSSIRRSKRTKRKFSRVFSGRFSQT